MKDVIITDTATKETEPTTVIIPKEVAKQAPIKFGLGQITMPTPQIVTQIFRVILYAAALVSIVVPMFPEIPSHIADLVSRWAIRLVALSHAISKLFGIDLSAVLPPISVSNSLMSRSKKSNK